MQRFIVAEATKNWTKESPKEDLLSDKFENIINTNYDRGYDLLDWKISTVVDSDVFTETIIAVFKFRGG